MRFGVVMTAVVLCLCVVGAAGAQSWDAASSTGTLKLEWMVQDQVYTFKIINPVGSGVLAWDLEPFNLPSPVETTAPTGWVWQTSKGWSSFEIVSEPERYVFGGPAIEPGESLTFVYKAATSGAPVNAGGPAGGDPAFLVHVAAVSGYDGSKWNPTRTGLGNTWFDIPVVIYDPNPVVIPEPASLLNISLGIFAVGCLGVKRARV